MDLLNKKVKHETFGMGTVQSYDTEYMMIDFQDRAVKFQYPDAFKSFLTAEDADIQAAILEKIEKAQEELEERKALEEEAVRAKKLEEVKAKDVRTDEIPDVPQKTYPAYCKDSEKRFFYVFQGLTYERESNGNYLWAPIANSEGRTQHHWDRLLDVREGDIILHGYEGRVQAVSIAKGEAYDCDQPEELIEEGESGQKGRRIDSDYTPFQIPIETDDFIDEIISFPVEKYDAFNKRGKGNAGYLFYISCELAKVFIEAAVKANPYLADEDYIQDLLQADEDN
ncbi:MAG: hypothetical protein GX127_05105 [Eubacteriaceae bacterium]|nr:hypothetical protein [Eubacteriaceae bacterium]